MATGALNLEAVEQPRLAALISRCEALPVDARLRLAALLDAPGHPVAFRPAELAARRLPLAPDSRAAVGRAVVEGLGRDALRSLAACRVNAVFPAISGRTGGVAAHRVPARLLAVLERRGATSWEVFGRHTIGEISGWPGIGPSAATTLVGVVVEAALAFLREDGASPSVLAVAERALATVGDVRDRVVFEQAVLLLDDSATPTRLGVDLGLSAERIRQLRSRAEERVRAALSDGPAEWQGAVAAVAAELGPARPRAAAEELLGSLGLPDLADPRSLLVLWAAGPYRPVAGHPGWLATDPDGLSRSTRRLLCEDGGVRPVEHVVKELERLGMLPDVAAGWLAEQPVRVHEGLVVLTTGGPAAVAERALSATGQAMACDDLSGWVAAPGEGRTGAAVASLCDVLRRDGRFVEVGRDRYELAEWGAQPYHDDVPVAGEPGEWGRAHDGRCWLRVVVENDVLAGAAGRVPVGLVDCLAVRSGVRRPFSTRYGPVVLTNDRSGPARGSLRAIALATGAVAGDTLVLCFSPPDDLAAVELTRATAAAS